MPGIPSIAGLRDSNELSPVGLLNLPSGVALASSLIASEATQSTGSTSNALLDLLFIADEGDHAIRVVDLSTGQLSTFAGSTTRTNNIDGLGTAAGIHSPHALTIDASNTYLYVTSRSHKLIRRISLASRQVDTLTLRGFQFSDLTHILVHPHSPHRLYLTDFGYRQVSQWQVDLADPKRQVVLLLFAASTTAIFWVNTHTLTFGALAGIHGVAGTNDSPSALFSMIQALAVRSAANGVYVGDECRIRTIAIDARLAVDSASVTTIGGVSGDCTGVDGGVGAARFGSLVSIMPVGDSILYLAAFIGGGATCSVIQSVPGFLDGIGARAQFMQPTHAIIDTNDANRLDVADETAPAVRLLDLRTQEVTTIVTFDRTAMMPSKLSSITMRHNEV